MDNTDEKIELKSEEKKTEEKKTEEKKTEEKKTEEKTAEEKKAEQNKAVDAEVLVEEKDDLRKHTLPVRKLRYARAFIMELFIVVLIIYLLVGVIYGVLSAPNGDMYPVAAAGDLLVYYRLDKDVKSQDIIVYTEDTAMRVGRVVAKGGDILDITEEGNVIVNGSTVIEPNIHTPTYRFERYVEYPVTLEENECFVLCEQRNGTEDSRYLGPIRKSMIKGTVITIIRRNSL